MIAASAAAAAAPPGGAGSPGPWKAGFAQADITPKPGMPVMPAGFGGSRIMEGSESPLLAQALALEDADGKRAILFTADLLGFGRITIDAVRHKIAKAHGIPGENVCFSASHTHWAPAVNFRTGSAIGDPNIWYLGFLETTLLDLADRALKNLAPAEVAYGWTEAQIGMNRRLPGAQGIQWAVNPAGSYDRHTPILRVRRETSPRQVIVVGHACHPTSLGKLNQWSPDYPGAMRRKLEADLEDCRAMFVNGAGGDAKVVYRDPATGRHEFAASLERSHEAGLALAQAILARIRTSLPLEPLDARLGGVLVRGKLSLQAGPGQEEIKKLALDGSLTGATTWWARKMLAFPDARRDFDYAVQSWQLGELTIVAMEGEVCADWGAFARGLPATKHAMTIGYANEVSSYIPTARLIQEGGYESDLSHKIYLLPGRFDPKMEVELTALIRRAVAHSAGQPPPLEPVPFDRSRLLVTTDGQGSERRITSPVDWEARRRQIVAHVELAMGPLPGAAFRVPLDLQVLEEVDCGSFVRRKIAYNVDLHDRVESFLLVPKKLRGKTPAILALHGTNSKGKDLVVGLVEKVGTVLDAGATRRQYYAQELAERGYVVLAPDYWYNGLYHGKRYNVAPDQKYDPHERGYATAAMKGVWNHMRAIDVLETLPEVDIARIGSIGHSLGGYNTLFLGLFDPRVKVMVSSAGYNAFADYAASKYGGGDLKNWGIDKHLRRIRTVYGDDAQQVPFDFPELLAALAPRPVFTNAPLSDDYFDHPGVLRCQAAARPVYELFGAAGNLEILSPEARHDFPDAQRQAAYEFLDRHLRGTPSSR
ncbi:MAG: dienelactone hydrolase family protein [Verrucomicrobia bacterium]|nr:dienelactone hydrolase family protein [Verrucomicrobiota bacterium]